MRYGAALICLAVLGGQTLLSSAARAACGAGASRPSIHVVARMPEPEFDFTHPVEALNRLRITRPVSAAYAHAAIGGAAGSAISVRHKMIFNSSVREGGTGCVALKDITVTIEADPKVYVASGLLHDNQCLFREVFGHEAKHIEVDRALLQKYRARFTDGLKMMLTAPADYRSGELPQDQLVRAREQIQDEIERGLGVLYTEMAAERRDLQLAVDSDSEYDRLNGACHVSS